MKKDIVIAMDLGGTRIKLGLVSGPEVLASLETDACSEQGLAQRLPGIAEAIRGLLAQKSIGNEALKGVGIAIPGIVDSVHKKVLTINDKYGDVISLDLEKWAAEHFGVPLEIENDTRAALLGEWKFGNGRGYNDVVLMTLGTGIGTSAVIEGKILRGKHFQAGILGGHFIVNPKGRLCNCGNVGCAEAEASTWNLAEIVSAHNSVADSEEVDAGKLDFKLIFELAADGNQWAKTIRGECLEVWAACAFNLVQAYDPEVLILGGGIMASRDHILPHIQSKLKGNSWCSWGEVKVLEASLKNTAALLGVGSLF
ncbi:ROK family protein [Emticicia sp. CRIBPO]|uniref:ROK family protein n=1 Tax=Emticicia sp. CRIBPO TaxID=2683258 RepID=UPI001411B793|nr:ROK family protein [Emticicia sp. CRIBPO]NBA89193.1 ROK family protein [Emticicia sp. CRIBPO]